MLQENILKVAPCLNIKSHRLPNICRRILQPPMPNEHPEQRQGFNLCLTCKTIENRMCSMGSRLLLFCPAKPNFEGNDSIDRTLFSAEASENREREK